MPSTKNFGPSHDRCFTAYVEDNKKHNSNSLQYPITSEFYDGYYSFPLLTEHCYI